MAEDIFNVCRKIKTYKGNLNYYSLYELNKKHNIEILPYSIRILLENALRNYDNFLTTKKHINALLNWKSYQRDINIPYSPSRVLMQDFTGVPAVVDIASLRSEIQRKGKDPNTINPIIPVDLIIDHSVQVDYYGTNYSYLKNVETEYVRNDERYSFLKWGQKAFKNFIVLPPGMGICHQVNLEYLAKGVTIRNGYIFPDTLVGTDSHTPMINGIGVLGWGVGGIEAEAAMLGQPIYMLLPEVIGLKLTGKLKDNVTSTDLVLHVTKFLRKKGVVGKFVEVFGDGLDNLTVPDRATISNMSPEFGCTVTYFPIDDQTLKYMRNTTRSKEHVELVEAYSKINLLWREKHNEIVYTKEYEINLDEVETSISGPKRPQEKISIDNVKLEVVNILKHIYDRDYVHIEQRELDDWLSDGGCIHQVVDGKVTKICKIPGVEIEKQLPEKEKIKSVRVKFKNTDYLLTDASIVIAAITSCTNTSNPVAMISAGLLAKKAVEKGLNVKPWVKTSLAPGSKVVTRYLEKANLLPSLEALKFHVVGYGCTTCIGNSGHLPDHIENAITENELVVASVLSGNRNFEARIHPNVKMNFLMSPLLVVAYALAGRIDIDFSNEPIDYDPNSEPVYLSDLWPSKEEIDGAMLSVLSADDFKDIYSNLYDGDEKWQSLEYPHEQVYKWDNSSTYIKEAPFFKDISIEPEPTIHIKNARALLVLGDTITTDHISPAGTIGKDTPAGKYLQEHGVYKKLFNSYGSRRGNHEVMVRGTFANVRLENKLVTREGGFTIHHPDNKEMSVYDAAMKYAKEKTPLIVIGGKDYGSGSSRDWAAKGTALLGIVAVIAQSFERIHRSNLVGMGVLPLEFKNGDSFETFKLKGNEKFNICCVHEITPNCELTVTATDDTGHCLGFTVIVRLDSEVEVSYYKHGGILNYVLRNLLKE